MLVDGFAGYGGEEAQEVGVAAGGGVGGCEGKEVLWSDGRYEGDGFGVIGDGEVLLCYPCCSDATDCFACRRPTAARRHFDAVFLEVREVCVTGARVLVHGGVAVVFGTLVFVADDHGNRCAEGEVEFGAGLDFDVVIFIAGGC